MENLAVKAIEDLRLEISEYAKDTWSELSVHFLSQEIAMREGITVVKSGYDEGVELIRDFILYTNFDISVLRGVDEKFIYELTRNPLEIDSIMVNTDDFESGFGYGHWFAVRKATELKIGYRRWRRE